jgi:hypothetical protein
VTNTFLKPIVDEEIKKQIELLKKNLTQQMIDIVNTKVIEKKIKNKSKKKIYMNDRYSVLAKEIIDNDETYVNSLYD